MPPRSSPRDRGQLRAVRRIDNFVNILPGDEDLENEEDVLSELDCSDDEEDFAKPALADQSSANLITFDSDDDVSVLRMKTVMPPPPCSSLTVNLVKALATPPMDVVLSFAGKAGALSSHS